jgi:Flp pilus assembly protein TadB
MEAFPSLNKNSNFYSLTIKISIMKTTKVFLFLAFLFCISFSKNAEAAASQSNQISMTTIVKDKQQLSTKSLKKSIKKKFKKVKKDVKKFLKGQKENASVRKLLLLAIVGLAMIGLSAIISGISFIGFIGGILVTIAVVWWILQLLDII